MYNVYSIHAQRFRELKNAKYTEGQRDFERSCSSMNLKLN